MLAKDESKKAELADVLFILADCLAHLGYILTPFLPTTASHIIKRLELPDEKKMNKRTYCQSHVKPGAIVDRGEALFPRLEDE